MHGKTSISLDNKQQPIENNRSAANSVMQGSSSGDRWNQTLLESGEQSSDNAEQTDAAGNTDLTRSASTARLAGARAGGLS